MYANLFVHSCFYLTVLDNTLHSLIVRELHIKCAPVIHFFRELFRMLQNYTRATETSRFAMFFARLDEPRENCDTTAVLGSLNPQVDFHPLPRASARFLRRSGRKKRALVPSSRTELSRFILSTRAGLRLFCLLARGHLNCASAL